jgi:hypothetical protein
VELLEEVVILDQGLEGEVITVNRLLQQRQVPVAGVVIIRIMPLKVDMQVQPRYQFLM